MKIAKCMLREMCPELGKGPEGDRRTFCSQCGSMDIYYASGLPQMWSIWECRRCGYRGPVVVEDGELGKKLREEWEKEHLPKG
jgi:NMD protein affecting ribosome stability and mRNA decay